MDAPRIVLCQGACRLTSPSVRRATYLTSTGTPDANRHGAHEHEHGHGHGREPDPCPLSTGCWTSPGEHSLRAVASTVLVAPPVVPLVLLVVAVAMSSTGVFEHAYYIGNYMSGILYGEFPGPALTSLVARCS